MGEVREQGVRKFRWSVPFDGPDKKFGKFLHSITIEKPIYAKDEKVKVKRSYGKIHEYEETKTFVLPEDTAQAERLCHEYLEKRIPEIIKLGYTPYDNFGKSLTKSNISYMKRYPKYKGKFRYTKVVKIINSTKSENMY